jgi:hypothetical protein
MTAKRIRKAGLYEGMPAADYHADPCVSPSLSRSVAVTLLDRSPAHAWTAHPRLNPDFEQSESKRFDMGSACHDLMLGEPDRFAVVRADNWQGFSAKRRRDDARKIGLIPILERELEQAHKIVASCRDRLASHPGASDAFVDGVGESTLIWSESVKLDSGKSAKIWLRIRLDWRTPGSRIFYDLKTTETSAAPDAWTSLLFRESLDVQAAFYRRGISRVLNIPTDEIVFRFVVVEIQPPFGVSVVELDSMAMDFAERKVRAAIKLWAECLTRDEWPAYPNRIAYARAPAWAESSWLDRESRDAADKADGRSMFSKAIAMQAPLNQRK